MMANTQFSLYISLACQYYDGLARICYFVPGESEKMLLLPEYISNDILQYLLK